MADERPTEIPGPRGPPSNDPTDSCSAGQAPHLLPQSTVDQGQRPEQPSFERSRIRAWPRAVARATSTVQITTRPLTEVADTIEALALGPGRADRRVLRSDPAVGDEG